MKGPKEWLNSTTRLPRALKWRITRSRISTANVHLRLDPCGAVEPPVVEQAGVQRLHLVRVDQYPFLVARELRQVHPGVQLGGGPPCESSQTVPASGSPPSTVS